MFFDDRLSTVLRQEGSSEPAKRTQFRQLLDILGNRKFGAVEKRDRSLIAAAWLRMDALGRSIPAKDRAAIIEEPSWRFRSADLAAHLSDFEPEVASAALNRAELSREDWLALIPRLPVRARGFLRLRRDLPPEVEQLLDKLGVYDRGLPSPAQSAGDTAFPLPQGSEEHIEPEAPPPLELGEDEVVEEAPTPEARRSPTDPIETGRSEISALVERIAQFKRNREASDYDALTDSDRSPRLPLGEIEQANVRRVNTFGFAANASGRIEWAEAEAAPMVIGTRLVPRRVLGERDRETPLERAFALRQPIAGYTAELQGAVAIAGDWIVDAQPRFTLEGHFTGYVGRFRRPGPQEGEGSDESAREADRIRQLLHELRTPVTAVQGYAEVIQQQLFGPAPHEYRALAAAIAADAAHILAGFEDMDRLARLETGTIAMEPGETDLAMVLRQTSGQLTQVLAPRMAGIDLDIADTLVIRVPLDQEETELLIWRFLATLGGGCGANEFLDAELLTREDAVVLTCDLPRKLLEEEDIFTAEGKPVGTAINAGIFGAGFALRLARAEARGAKGSLSHTDGRITLKLPMLVETADDPLLTRV
ncbi:MAG: histidine kinase dimerization/phospho-acceptor domain-containing protein [Pseudomonadota bacterium]